MSDGITHSAIRSAEYFWARSIASSAASRDAFDPSTTTKIFLIITSVLFFDADTELHELLL